MSIRHSITQLSLTATVSEKRIIDYFLQDYPLNALGNLQAIAKQTHCSVPTVQRLAVKLGFEGFPDFRKALLAELSREKSTSPLSRMRQQNRDKPTDSNNTAAGESTYQQTLSNIQATFEHLPPQLLLQAARLLADEKYAVWCLGGRFTGTLATLFARHLKTVRHRVREFTPYEGALADIYADSNAETLLFVTDIRRYDTPTIKLCEAAKEKQASIILVTDNWLSPAEKSADIVIPVYTNSPSGWDSNACLLVVLEEIMSIVTHLLGKTGQENLQNRESFLDKVWVR